MQRLGNNQECPCGTGKKYKHCCRRRNIIFEIDDRGNTVRRIQFEPDFAEELKAYNEVRTEEFKKIFGREPTTDDKFFFQIQGNNEIAEMEEFTLDMLQQAGCSDEYIYAYKKTGLLLTDVNLKHLTTKDLIDWKSAITEYREMRKAGRQVSQQEEDPDKVRPILLQFEKSKHIVTELLNAEIEFGDQPEDSPIYDAIRLTLRKLEQNIKSIMLLANKPDSSGDTLSLTRSIYETYLAIQYALRNPEKANKAFSEEIKKRDKANNSEYTEDGKIHKSLYEHLCNYAHPELRTLTSYESNEESMIMRLEASLISTLYVTLTLYEIMKNCSMKDITRSDLQHFIRESKDALLKFFSSAETKAGEEDWAKQIPSRLARLTTEQ